MVLLACVLSWGCAATGTGNGPGGTGAEAAGAAADAADAEAGSAAGAAEEGEAQGEARGASERATAEEGEGARRGDRRAGDLPAERATPARPDSGTAWVIFGADTVVAEVAATSDARTRGLQGRESLPPNRGMLFVYPERDVRSFWMVNTPVALDIAFLDTMDGRELEEEGRVPAGTYRVVDVQSMEPETSTLHTSAAPAVMALEVSQGWFAAHGVEAGDTATVVWGG